MSLPPSDVPAVVDAAWLAAHDPGPLYLPMSFGELCGVFCFCACGAGCLVVGCTFTGTCVLPTNKKKG